MKALRADVTQAVPHKTGRAGEKRGIRKNSVTSTISENHEKTFSVKPRQLLVGVI